ncbi:MAG: hypothetical protein GY832_16035 [Chloroflexi bacterium]|nr:hypothetical protein [Chloroflexota bacterium]
MKYARVSTLSLSECTQRLADGVDEYRDLFPDLSRPFLGKVDGHRFKLRARGLRRNSFAPVFYGRFRKGVSETIIEGYFGFSPLVTAFVIVWFGFATMFTCMFALGVGAVFVAALTGTEFSWVKVQVDSSTSPILPLLFPLALPLFGIGAVLVGKALGKEEEASILSFLEGTLDAHPVQGVE